MRGSLIMKPNAATRCEMRWKRSSENLQPEKLFRLDCRLSPLITVWARDLNVHLQYTHSSRMQSSFMFVFICLSKLLLFKVCDFHQQSPVNLLSCSVDLQNVFRTSWPLINLSGALWPVQRWLLIRFNSWLISLNWGLIGCLSNPPGLAEINRQHDFGALMDADAGAGTLVRVLTQQIPQ